MTDKKPTPQDRWQKENIKRFTVKVAKNTESSVLEKLESVPNYNRYIKKLIKKDIKEMKNLENLTAGEISAKYNIPMLNAKEMTQALEDYKKTQTTGLSGAAANLSLLNDEYMQNKISAGLIIVEPIGMYENCLINVVYKEGKTNKYIGERYMTINKYLNLINL